nr:polysaccharide biosynthesis/export family protein [Sphingomicrobium astaxanthinifaciens]
MAHHYGDGSRHPAAAAEWSLAACQPPATSALVHGLEPVDAAAFTAAPAPLSPGDRLHIALLGDVDALTGTYVVGSDGTVTLPGLAPQPAAGLSPARFERALEARLVADRIVRPVARAVTVSRREEAGIDVTVEGAVFAPGAVRVGDRRPESLGATRDEDRSGDDNPGRGLAAAIRAASGIRPDADLSAVHVLRGRRYAKLDLRAPTRPAAGTEMRLAAGDRIHVPSRGCFDELLVRPGPLSPPGVSIYASNLTQPATNNAGAALDGEALTLPYGSRLLQALAAMNCIGGSYFNSDRRAVLISRNPVTRQSIVVERDIEGLVRHADRDRYDPYLMPGDAIACYDSRWTNFSEALGMVGRAVNPALPAIALSKTID